MLILITNKDILQFIGKKIKKARLDKNLTQDALAEKVNISTDLLRNIENDETRLLKLQRQYEKGEIATGELSDEQVLSLKELYQKQIGNLEKSNENRKRKILQHKDGQSFWKSIMNTENDETKLLKLQRQYDSGNIKVEDLSDSQMKDLIKLYKNQISELSKSNEARKQKLLQYRKRLQAT